MKSRLSSVSGSSARPSDADGKSDGAQSVHARAAASRNMTSAYDGVKVFSATKANERAELGERVTKWLECGDVQVVDTVVRQSSDNQFHCLSILIFYVKR